MGQKNGKYFDPNQKSEKIRFVIKGEEHSVHASDIGPETTLNDYLRHKLVLVGTKRMCYEGGCGSCVVAVMRPGEDKVIAVNSCLVSILSCQGWKIDTIEGIGNAVEGFNNIQKVLAKFNGTQCGFCSPGFVMNMYALMSNGKPKMKDVEDSFGGNICRCTGYRPILSAFKSLCEDASVDILGEFPDIEDMVCKKKSDHSEIPTTLEPSFAYDFGDALWTKVHDMEELLNKLDSIGNKTYMLVAGNTAKGVYPLPKPQVYIDIIDVKELVDYERSTKQLKLGAGMTLTYVMELMLQTASSDPNFGYLKTIANHISLVANVPVRNIGSLAGNLMIKHMHNEFPSDIFLTLATFGATLDIVDVRKNIVNKTPVDFLKLDMKKKVIQCIRLPAYNNDYKYQTYKIMARAQNVHAHVNAGFLYKLNSSQNVEQATIIFGNINPQFINASKTEQLLVGKKLFDNMTLQKAFTTLSEELQPAVMLPEPPPEYRKQLAIALFYKGILSIAPENRLSSKIKSGRSILERPISKGAQDYETQESLYPLTKPIPKIEALAQTSGEAEYVEDIPDHPHQLYGKLILAKAPPGSELVKIDATKALAVPTIEKFYTKDDIPGENTFIPPGYGLPPPTVIEKLFADGEIQYYHQPIGILIGSDRNVVETAASLIDISYKPPKTSPLITIPEILNAGSSAKITQEQELKAKDKGKDVTKTLTGRFNMGPQAHFHMELQCCLVIPTENGGLNMYTATQWMDVSQASAAHILNIPLNKIFVEVRRCGGAYGGKLTRNAQISSATALAAWLIKKPVRLALTLKENMSALGKRFPFLADYKVDINSGGVIQYLDAKFYSDQSSGGNEKQVNNLIMAMTKSYYNPDRFNVTLYDTYSQTPGNTFCRAPGSVESTGFIESLMDHIAYELNMDPIDVRLNNITKDMNMKKYLAELQDWADIATRKRDIADFNKANRWKKRGISCVPMSFPFEIIGPINAAVSIFRGDGSVTISHGGIEIGQGINTKAVQVCAYKFNIPLEKVNVHPSNTVISPNCFPTAASQTSEAVCYGVDKACDELIRRLEPFRKDGQTWEELIQAAFQSKPNTYLTASAQYSPGVPVLAPYQIYGACAAEVEVDILTGQHIITRVDLIEDAGTALSPNVDIGQIEGAFVMGLGYYLTENIVFNKDGKLLTNNTWTYYPPGAKDIPVDFRIKIPKNNPNPKGVLQSKAVGEPPLCLSVSIPLAIRHALASARSDADPSKFKYFLFDGATTIETTFMNSLNNFKQYIL